ncbi:MAG: CDP-glucose 4,6-dehydratase, partial [Gammaproteobacteria bacterium]|jgi:CDP-glucose 4,6-dehydratase|nr:CDP-glucose 4,6-dehydratase [Gammaproteobacteria bacterium]
MANRQSALEGLVMNAAFWRNKKVFLTGHTGFKGSWLSLWLQEMGAQVTGYSLKPSSQPCLFELANVAKGMQSLMGDIRDLDALKKAVAEAKPDIIIHMAAQALVRDSYTDPVGTYSTNVMGTVHIIEAMRASPTAKVLINVTSDKCYENKEWVWGYRENEPMGGYDPYSNSKGCSELVTSSYRQSFLNPKDFAAHGKAIASARAGNVIGGGDFSRDRLVPDLIKAFIEKKPALIRHPQAIRPWQHVLEPLSGYLSLAEKLWDAPVNFSGAWNFGPFYEDSRPVSWLADLMVKQWGQNAGWQKDDAHHPHEAHYLKLDISKALSELQWRPRLSLEQSLDHTVFWYKSWYKGADVRALCLQQIKQYLI